MDYQGPTPDDLANVAALNSSYLCIARDAPEPVLPRLTPGRIARLAQAPFLLFSFREDDRHYWRRLLDPGGQLELRDATGPMDNSRRDLRVAAAGFLWELARRNAFAARLVSGASQDWCDMITGLTLVDLHRRVAARDDLIRPRFPDDAPVWDRLVAAGSGAPRELRRAAQLSAFQDMLTRIPAAGDPGMQAAACRTSHPARVSPRSRDTRRRL